MSVLTCGSPLSKPPVYDLFTIHGPPESMSGLGLLDLMLLRTRLLSH